MAYTTWVQVQELYPRASDVEGDSADQAALIAAKTNLFSSFIRSIHKAALIEPVDEVVNLAVSYLVVGELRRRARTQTGDSEFIEFKHISGKFFDDEMRAHSIIQAINNGGIVLGEDNAERDVHHPEAIGATGNTSTGIVGALLPHDYKNNQKDVYLIKVTTAGRVDAETAKFDYFINNNATAAASAQAMAGDWTHLGNELYVRFRDAAQTGEQFAINDAWTITALPPHSESRGQSMRNIDFFQS